MLLRHAGMPCNIRPDKYSMGKQDGQAGQAAPYAAPPGQALRGYDGSAARNQVHFLGNMW